MRHHYSHYTLDVHETDFGTYDLTMTIGDNQVVHEKKSFRYEQDAKIYAHGYINGKRDGWREGWIEAMEKISTIIEQELNYDNTTSLRDGLLFIKDHIEEYIK